jgi:hypothetical protein
MNEMREVVVKINEDVKSLSKILVFHVDDAETNQKAAEYLGHVKARKERIEELRVKFVKPLNDQVKVINNTFKMEMEPLLYMEEHLKREMKSYLLAENARAEEEAKKKREEFLLAEKKRKEEMEELAKQMTDASEEEKEKIIEQMREMPVVQEEVVEEVSTTTRSSTAVVSAKKVWKYEIVDIATLHKEHPEFFVPDEKLVKTFIKDIKEETTISGIRIFQDIVIASR